jgi:hypothetical protein
MLDVHRADNVDPGIEEFEDILITLLIPTPRDVGVGEFIDNRDLWPSCEHGLQIHFLYHDSAVLDSSARDTLKPFDKSGSIRATMSFDERQDHVYPAFFEDMGFL